MRFVSRLLERPELVFHSVEPVADLLAVALRVAQLRATRRGDRSPLFVRSAHRRLQHGQRTSGDDRGLPLGEPAVSAPPMAQETPSRLGYVRRNIAIAFTGLVRPPRVGPKPMWRAYARVAVGAHWPSDVLLTSIICLTWIWAASRVVLGKG